MVTNMLYGGPFRCMRLLQEEVNRLAQSAALRRGWDRHRERGAHSTVAKAWRITDDRKAWDPPPRARG